MKGDRKMKKTFASALAFLLVVMMVFVGVAPTISYAAESRSAAKDISISDVVDEATDWVDIDRDGDELILTLNPEMS